VSVEVWAINATAGEAILRGARRWLLLALDTGWQPTPLQGYREVLRWAQSGSPVPVGKTYRRLEDAIGEVREACLAALGSVLDLETEAGVTSAAPEAPRNIFLDRAWRRFATKERAEEIIAENSGRLERYFEARGFARARCLALTADVFARLWRDNGGRAGQLELGAKLFQLARQVSSEVSRPPARPRTGRRRAAAARDLAARERQLTERLAMRIGSLPEETLVTLAAWTDLDRSRRDVEILLGSPTEAARLLRETARALGMREELLRVHLFASACQRAARLALSQRAAG
jgi:hypothetical protein